MHGDGYMFFGDGFMWIFWIVLVVVIALLLKQIAGSTNKSKEQDALEVLKQRYAKGEVDEAEYQKKKSMLEKD